MTTPLTWITDRLPTEADGDADGDIAVLGHEGSRWFVVPWDEVGSNQPWLPFIPPGATPEPTAPTSQRRIVSITESAGTVLAVADDGSAWWLSADLSRWTQLPALPQREAE